MHSKTSKYWSVISACVELCYFNVNCLAVESSELATSGKLTSFISLRERVRFAPHSTIISLFEGYSTILFHHRNQTYLKDTNKFTCAKP